MPHLFATSPTRTRTTLTVHILSELDSLQEKASFFEKKQILSKGESERALLIGIVTNFLAELFNYNNGLLEDSGTPRWNNVTVIYAGKNTGKAADTSATFKMWKSSKRVLPQESLV